MAFLRLFLASLLMIAASAVPALATRVCVEEAAGVCLKYKDVPDATPAPASRTPSPASTAEREERALSLSRDERREVQAGLRAGGYYSGSLDGAIGRGTRTAISRWQSDNGESVTGYLTFDQVRRLRAASLGRQPASQPQPAPQPQPQPQPQAVVQEPHKPEPPARPARGQSYRRTFGANAPESWLDPMSVEVKVLRRDDATATIAFRLYDANQYAFSHECVVPVKGEFICGFYGPNRNKNTWSISGDFPKISVANGWISFSKSWRLWE